MLKTLTETIIKAIEDGQPVRTAVAYGELAVRREYAGERVYIPARNADLTRAILQSLGTTGASVNDRARVIGISRRTLYRHKGQK